jgi:exosome complex component RRP40
MLSSLLNFSLCSRNNHVIGILGEYFPFETAIGMNGRVWVDAGSSVKTSLVSYALQKGFDMSKEEFKELISNLVNKSGISDH